MYLCQRGNVAWQRMGLGISHSLLLVSEQPLPLQDSKQVSEQNVPLLQLIGGDGRALLSQLAGGLEHPRLLLRCGFLVSLCCALHAWDQKTLGSDNGTWDDEGSVYQCVWQWESLLAYRLKIRSMVMRKGHLVTRFCNTSAHAELVLRSYFQTSQCT